MVVVSSKVVTAWATAVRTPGRSSSPHWKGKEHYQQHPMQGQVSVSTGQGSVRQK